MLRGKAGPGRRNFALYLIVDFRTRIFRGGCHSSAAKGSCFVSLARTHTHTQTYKIHKRPQRAGIQERRRATRVSRVSDAWFSPQPRGQMPGLQFWGHPRPLPHPPNLLTLINGSPEEFWESSWTPEAKLLLWLQNWRPDSSMVPPSFSNCQGGQGRTDGGSELGRTDPSPGPPTQDGTSRQTGVPAGKVGNNTGNRRLTTVCLATCLP